MYVVGAAILWFIGIICLLIATEGGWFYLFGLLFPLFIGLGYKLAVSGIYE